MPDSRPELAIAYRVYPGISKTPMIHPEDKLALTRTCLESFASALGNVSTEIFVILDGCPPSYRRLFEDRLAPWDLEFLEVDAKGNQATFSLQIQTLLTRSKAPLVGLVEDDYLYQPRAFESLVDFLKTATDVDFVTPYDHIDYYTMRLHRCPAEIRVHRGSHWRTAATTCLTFLTRRETLRQTAPAFEKFSSGVTDAAIWLSLTKTGFRNPAHLFSLLRSEWPSIKYYGQAWLQSPKQSFFGRGRKLWVPTPSLATHAELTGLAPCVDWNDVANRIDIPPLRGVDSPGG